MRHLQSLFLLLYTLTFCAIGQSQAQNIQSISGQVTGATGDYIMGNILILNPLDSSLIKGTSFTEEPFFVEGINAPEVTVKFSSILFQDTSFRVRYTDNSNIKLGKIQVQKDIQDLAQITVTGKIPRFEEKADGSVQVNVDKTSLAASNSLEEILTKTPGVILGEEGYEIVGKESTIFFQNGKLITVEQLTLIQPANIKKIEIIRNPSAKYDADGAAVINITTIGASAEGFHLKLQQNVTYSDFAGTNMKTTISSNFAKNKLKLTGSYSFFAGDDREILHTTRDRDNPEVFLKTDLTTDWNWDHDNISTGNLGIQYDLNASEYISLEYSGSFERTNMLQVSNNKITNNEGVNFYESILDGKNPVLNSALSSNYYKSLDTLGSSLFVGAQYSNFFSERNANISEESIEQNIPSSRLLKNEYNHDINIYSGQIDYTKFWQNEMSLELGGKISQVENDSKLDFLIYDGMSEFVKDPALSTDYNYTERLAALYFNYRFNTSKQFNYAIGLRTEFTNYVAEILELDDLKNNFTNFFPYASFNTMLPNETPFSLIYSSSIQRPRFDQLNPVLYYQDPYTSIQGNPDLVPQKTHSVEAVTRRWDTSFKVGYSYTSDPLRGGAIRGDDEFSYILVRLNWDQKHEVYANLSKQFSTKWWTSINTFTLRYIKYFETEYGFAQRAVKPHPYLNTNNIFKLGKVCNLEVLYWYWGDLYEGIFHREDVSNLSITIEKSFFDKALNCRFVVNDVFNQFDPAGFYTVGETDIFFERERPRDNYRLSISYNFGKLKKLGYKNKSAGKAEMNRAN